MNLRHFLDAAFAIFVDEYRKMGMDLLGALEQMKEWAQGDGTRGEAKPSAAQNVNALQELESMMAGLR